MKNNLQNRVVATFSIVGCDLEAGEWGIAVQSKFLAVGSVVPWAKANVGAVATQSWANTSFGPNGLAYMEQGLSAQEALDRLIAEDEGRKSRQVGLVDRYGNAAAYTGEDCHPWAGHVTGPGFAAQGNILVNSETVHAMADTFQSAKGDLASRLLQALDAAQKAGGDSRGKQSAAILVVKDRGGYGGFNDRYVDLRVDDHLEPIAELRRLHELYKLYFYKTDPNRLVKIEGSVAQDIQSMLARFGTYQGEIYGVYDEATEKALHQFFAIENFEERLRNDDQIDEEVLRYMYEKYGT